MAGDVPLLYNPRAASGRGGALARKAARLLEERGLRARLVGTSAPGHASHLAEDLAKGSAERILVLGGDGTLSEAADGVLRSGRRPEMGFFPGGTGNSFLRDFGLSSLEDAVARVARGEPRDVDAALATWPGGERHFLNVFGVGFVARVCDFANRRLKWMGGRSYTFAVLPEVARLRSPPTRLALDGRAMDGEYALVSVCNTVHTGGGMRIAPMARPDDGWLDVVALRAVGRARLLRLFPKIFDGSHVGEPEVLVERARHVRVEPSEPSPLLGDGEVYGATPVEARVLPGALRALL